MWLSFPSPKNHNAWRRISRWMDLFPPWIVLCCKAATQLIDNPRILHKFAVVCSLSGLNWEVVKLQKQQCVNQGYGRLALVLLVICLVSSVLSAWTPDLESKLASWSWLIKSCISTYIGDTVSVFWLASLRICKFPAEDCEIGDLD